MKKPRIKVISIKPEFVDERGFISRVLDDKKIVIKSILYIQRKAGTVAANHYHKNDTHYIYCLSGKILYSEKNMREKDGVLESVILKAGDMVESKPYTAHATEFLEDTTMMAFATQHRTQEEYEADTVRIKIV